MLIKLLTKVFGSRNDRTLRRMRKVVNIINAMEPEMEKLSDEELKGKTAEFRARLEKGEVLENLIPEAFAVVREASKRVFGMRHFDVQLLGGMVLNERCIAEMRTGEGKTLTATLPAYLNALTGKGVHVVTVNDYLAQRDAENNRPLFEFLGLTVGINLPGMPAPAKREAYAADITYGTNNEYGFDYLRDNMAFSPEERVQRKLHYALVDEVDSILIDEARTPLIISGPAEDSSEMYKRVNKIIPHLIRQEKEDSETFQGEGHFSVDEKSRQVNLTERGLVLIEELLVQEGIMDEGESLYSPTNIMLMHHVTAALRAHALFTRDVDYIVKDGEVIIVDEHTGRTMQGRRWSDGLHQAVEAKEGVEIQNENQTLASITFQNYFRLYEKLAGMTGTADTEAFEFSSIYKLDTVVVPTNRPMIRVDQQDKVFKTEKEKYDAIVKDVKDCYSRGEPVLVGTTSIENSELLSHLMEKEGIPHNVLNAKQHEREAQIVAEAGRPGAVTIATNMAGRGTDIVLGGSISKVVDTIRHDESLTEEQKKAKIDEEKAAWQKIHEQVVKSGGLRIIGSERHESRLIDNQLRGRSGRQGDPGSTCFYLSMEDNLLKIFGGDRMKAMATHLKLEEGIPIESKMLSRMIENAQRKVEARNYDIRKQLLEFDDVQNDQRHEIYKVRNEILDSQDLSESVREMRHGFYSDLVRQYVPAETVEDQWDLDGLTSTLRSEWAVNLDTKAWMEEDESRTDEDLEQKVLDEADRVYNEKVELVGADAWNGFCRSVLLQVLDQTWRQHISALDLLRQGIFLRGYAQKQPKQEYKKEAFSMFEELLDLTREGVVRILMQVQIQMPEEAEEAEHEATEEAQRQVDAAQASQAEFTSLTAPENEPEAQEATVDDIAFAGVGRNDPCPCGSGKKFKDCHGKLN